MSMVRMVTAGQVVVLAALAPGVAGWVAGLLYGLVLAVLLARREPGPADLVTLARALLVGGVTALAFSGGGPVLVGVAALALALDFVDGRVARATGTASAFGARFDMEVDAFLILVLSVTAGPWWAVSIGAMRYAYWAASLLVPWLPGPLPPRYWRKVVAAIQGIVLLAATAGVPYATVAVAGALGLLIESFGRDVVWRFSVRDVRVPVGRDDHSTAR
jgi:phosphatidylglycerophosphate synthase